MTLISYKEIKVKLSVLRFCFCFCFFFNTVQQHTLASIFVCLGAAQMQVKVLGTGTAINCPKLSCINDGSVTRCGFARLGRLLN